MEEGLHSSAKKGHGHRRQASVGSCYHSARAGKLFDRFLIVGLAPPSVSSPITSATSSPVLTASSASVPPTSLPSGSSSKLQVLYAFPADSTPKEGHTEGAFNLPLHQVIRFCFPHGIVSKSLRIRDSSSELNGLLFGSIELIQRAANSFVFMLTHDQEVFYGVCVVNDEVLERPPSLVEKSLTPEWENPHATQRVYCFITKFPFFKSHFNVLYNLIGRERLYAVEENARFVQKLRGSTILESDIEEENELLTILKHYYDQYVPNVGEGLTISFPKSLFTVEIKLPSVDEDQLLANWSLPPTLKIFNEEQLVLLFNAAILEKHIVFVCRNKGILSSVVFSLLPLLRPFVWQGPFIPILPSDLQDYLQAPVPYIVGVLSLPEEIEKTLDTAVIVKIDESTQSIKLPKDGLVALPKYKKLIESIKPPVQYLHNYQLDRYYNPTKTTEKQWEAVGHILEDFQRYIQSFLDTLKPFIQPGMDMTTDVEKHLVDSSVKKIRPFVKALLDTQLFSVHFEGYTKALAEDQEKAKVMSTQIEHKIKDTEAKKLEAIAKMRALQRDIEDYEAEIRVLKETQRTLQAKHTVVTPRKKPSVLEQVLNASLDVFYKAATENTD